ncbi:MAG: homing endonuclease associated repeat-containing protein [Candidatus Asgardarchaeia archaeon]
MIKTQELLDDLKSVKNKIKSIPSKKYYDEYGRYNSATVERRFGTWNNALLECFGEVVRIQPPKRPIIECKNCGKKTKNPKFCSQSCNATYSNKRRYGPPNLCKICGKRIIRQSQTCRKCYIPYTMKKFGEKSIREFRKIPASKNRYQGIRNHAHQVARYYKLKSDKCLLCDYLNHLDLCHIKDIGSFNDDVTLNEINSFDNLVFLCPNHHWDLGHGKISKEEISRVRDLNPHLQRGGLICYH